MKNERVVKAVRLLVVIAILTAIVFVWNLIKNNKINFKSVAEAISGKNNFNDVENGVYKNIELLDKKISGYSGCTINSVNNLILVIEDEFYLFRSSCLGTYLKETGKSKDLKFGKTDTEYYISYKDKRYDKDNKILQIKPENTIALYEGDIDLNSLAIISKETQFDGNYYKVKRPVNGIGDRLYALFERKENGKFGFAFQNGKNEEIIYELNIDDFDELPSFYVYGNLIAMVHKADNPNDKNKYGYTLDSASILEEKRYDIHDYFPMYIDGEQINLEDHSVYIVFDEQERLFRMFIGNDKKMCNEEASGDKKMYYEFKIVYNYRESKLDKPQYVGIGYGRDGCSYINKYIKE